MCKPDYEEKNTDIFSRKKRITIFKNVIFTPIQLRRKKKFNKTSQSGGWLQFGFGMTSFLHHGFPLM